MTNQIPQPGETPSPEALRPEILLNSQQVFELIKSIEGREIAPGAVLYVGRRKPYEAEDGTIRDDKGMSTDAKNGKFSIFAPGTEHAGYEHSKLVHLTAKSLLTLARHALNPQLGETKSAKSEGYKRQQEDMAKVLCVLVDVRSAIDSETAMNPVETQQAYEIALDEAKQNYLNFMYEDLREEIGETEIQKAMESFENISTLIVDLKAKGEA